MVWSETETGVNDSVFAPNFFLPTLDTLIRRLPNDAWLGDFDVGEMFHNFALHFAHYAFHGVVFPRELWEEFGGEVGIWTRLPMGFCPSPYLAGRAQTWALEFAKGDPSDPHNPFGFVEVRLNLPMSPTFDPTQPRVQKLNHEGLPAGDVLMYVDDGRPFGRSEDHAMECMRQICSRLEYLGIQDAKRKRRPVSQRAGSWAGGVVFTDKGVPRKFLSQERWDKFVGYLTWMQDNLHASEGFKRQEFLRARGFIVYASMTYSFAVPFLKGIHLTADAWRKDRNQEGWKMKASLNREANDTVAEVKTTWRGDTVMNEQDNYFDDSASDVVDSYSLGDEADDGDEEVPDDSGPASCPAYLKPVPRLQSDLHALLTLFSGKSPIMVPIRPVRIESLVYGFGDASGKGFGSSAERVNEPSAGIRIRRGFWCTEISECTSNYREFHNLLDTIQDMVHTSSLEGAEIYLFTDNSTAEAVYYKGSSDSPKLFDLMLTLCTLALSMGFDLHLVHVAGTWMIMQGTDGLSRGELQLGSLLDQPSCLVPLHLDPLIRTDGCLLSWVYSWTGLSGDSLPVATPLDWMHEAHQPGFWIWSLPPAAAIYALEELAFARLKRGEDVGAIVLVPTLMKPEWFRRFARTVDVHFCVPAGHPCWPSSMHEPLMIGLVFPLLRFEPWHWRRVPFMVGLGRTLSGLHKTDHDAARNLLCKFWSARNRAARLPARMVCPLLLRPNYHSFLSLSE
jgi:hypothetical protein